MQENPDPKEKKEEEGNPPEAAAEPEEESRKETGEEAKGTGELENEGEAGEEKTEEKEAAAEEAEPEEKAGSTEEAEKAEGHERAEGHEKEKAGATGEERTAYTMKRRLTKSKDNRMLFGVCGGLGEYFGIDPTLVRLAFVVLTLVNGIGLIIYIILAVIMPLEEGVEMSPEETVNSNLKGIHEELRQAGEGVKDRSERSRLLGTILLIVGIYLVLDRLSVFRMVWWLNELFLPVILIVAGAWLLHKNRE